jgi:hypothetical protein
MFIAPLLSPPPHSARQPASPLQLASNFVQGSEAVHFFGGPPRHVAPPRCLQAVIERLQRRVIRAQAQRLCE